MAKATDSLLNKSATREFILAKVKALRPGWPVKQVSADYFERLDLKLRAFIVGELHQMPSKGVTIK